jgi:uncharacterized membrane protein SirB2
MFDRIAYALPFIMAGLLLVSLVTAITNSGQANWLTVAVVAVLLALMLGRRGRVAGTERHP